MAYISPDAGGDSFVKMRGMLGPGAVDSAIRQAITMCWMTLPDDKRNFDEVERHIRRVVDRALNNLREDGESFGLPGT
jgi:hypothetical protein